MKKLTVTILILMFIGIPVFSADLIRIPYPMTMRQRGMGDAFTAVADDYYLLFTNPAGLAQVKNMRTELDNRIVQIPLVSLGVGVQNKVVRNIQDLADALNSTDTTDAEQIAGVLETLGNFNRENFGFMIEDPFLAWGVVDEHIGFNFAPFLLDVNMKPIVGLRPEMYLDISTYLQAIFGTCPLNIDLFKNSRLDIGFGFKGVGLFAFEGSAELVDFFDWSEDSSQALTWLTDNMDLGFGFGLNVGAILSLPWGLNVGLSLLDAPTLIFYPNFEGSGELKTKFAFPNVRTGVSYSLDWQDINVNMPGWLLDNPIVAFDLTNLFDTSYKVWTKVHLGMSVNVINTKIFGLNAAAGLNKGYGTFSATARLFIVQLSYALWQDENGIKAGDYPVWQHLFSINLRL